MSPKTQPPIKTESNIPEDIAWEGGGVGEQEIGTGDVEYGQRSDGRQWTDASPRRNEFDRTK